jgi:transporter family-2 protein
LNLKETIFNQEHSNESRRIFAQRSSTLGAGREPGSHVRIRAITYRSVEAKTGYNTLIIPSLIAYVANNDEDFAVKNYPNLSDNQAWSQMSAQNGSDESWAEWQNIIIHVPEDTAALSNEPFELSPLIINRPTDQATDQTPDQTTDQEMEEGENLFSRAPVLFTAGILVIGAIVLIVLIVIFPATANFSNLPGISEWYLYVGGALGIAILVMPIYLVPRIGTTSTLIAIVLGQTLLALIIDHFGLFASPKIEMNIARGVGVLLVVIGAYLVGR